MCLVASCKAERATDRGKKEKQNWQSKKHLDGWLVGWLQQFLLLSYHHRQMKAK